MKIIILGAGQVGGTLAEHLASEANDITVVDTDGDRLRDLGDRLDIRTVQGKASFPTVLRQAGADDADMLVAVTNSDETNMVACQVAYTLFNTPTKIARVREPAYLTRTGLFDNEAIPVDVLISPEQVVTNYIKRLIEHPGALQVIDFAEGKAQLVGIKAYYGGPLVGQELRQLREHMPNVDTSKVMTLINNPAYVDLVQGGEIDIAISPQLATIGTLLAHVRRGDIESVHSLRRGAAEAIEVVAHGDAKSSKVIGRSINEIKLPPGTTIGALVRDEEVLIAHGDTRIESGDHVLLFLVDKKYIRDVERLFQAGLTFF